MIAAMTIARRRADDLGNGASSTASVHPGPIICVDCMAGVDRVM